MNFFSPTSTFSTSLENLEKFIARKITEKLNLIHLQKSETSDPVIKLLDDIKTRKIKVIIPSEEDTTPYLTNDKSIKKSVYVDVNLKRTNFKFEKPVRFPHIFKNQRSPNFPTLKQKLLLEKLKKIPIYVVVTNQDEMVMAMSRDKEENNLLSWVYKKYYNSFVWTEDEGPVSLGLFFMNKEDAQLYLHEIVNANPQMVEKSEVRVKMVGLDTFYRLNRTSPPGQQAKLIADLEEIEKMIQEYLQQKNHLINPKQKYNKLGYKGNPIYIIKPAYGIERYGEKDIKLVDFSIKNSENKKYIFFKLQDAHAAWDKFCEDHKELKLPLYPKIEIYNLENYLLDLEQSYVYLVEEVSFISTQDSFKNLKIENDVKIKRSNHVKSKEIKKLIFEKFKNFQSFSKKVLWVLTSDTLPTEKNAW